MNRRTFLAVSAGAVAAGAAVLQGSSKAINVAFVISDGATVIDFCGPWEVFQDVDHDPGFRLYTVSDDTRPLRGSGGLQFVPDYTFADAPPPKIVVVGAQRGRSRDLLDWLRASAKSADLVMSVCTGAFILARAGLLTGRPATTHHDFFDAFAREYPDVKLVRGKRFVESDGIATAGGLTSGIDLALHVVARYFGQPVAERTARYMEYESDGWRRGAAAAPAAES